MWTAKISKEEMAMELFHDLTKKFRQLSAMKEGRTEKIVEGLVDGLRNITFPYPIPNSGVPDYLKSMEPDYVAGFEVGSTWRKIAQGDQAPLETPGRPSPPC